MSEQKFKKGIEDIKKIGLTGAEKFQIKSNLDFYIETNTPSLPVKSSWLSSISHVHISMYSTAFALVLVFVTGWGTYSNAENSLPGDVLYPIKVRVIEPIKYTTAIGEVAKANLEVANLDQRLREAEMLEVQGKLTDAISNDLQNRISTHSDAFNKIVQDLSSQNKIEEDSDLKIDFESRINAHGRVIDSITNSENAINISKIKRVISKKSSEDKINSAIPVMASAKAVMFSMEAVPSVSSSTEVSTTTDDVFGKRKKDTEEIIKAARKNIEKSKKTLKINKKILDDAEVLVNDAQKSLEDAEKQNRNGDREGARQFLIDSRVRVKEANSSIEISQDLSKDED
jgi:hypothetical protein